MEDIGDATSVATSPPEEAAKNISNANLFSIDPRYAAQNKSTFDQKADQMLKPQLAEPPVANYMRQSSEHTALATPDVDSLNWMAKQKKMIGDYVFDRPTTERQIVDLNLKRMNNGGKLESDDEIALLSANQDAADQSTRNYGLNGALDKVPAFIASGITEFGQSIVRGARKGLFEGPLANIPPSVLGRHPMLAAAGLYYGTMIKDPFDTLSAGMYNELSNMTGPDGQPKNLDHDTKLAYSRGVGLVGTALMNGAGMAVAEATPFLKPFINPALMKGMINTPAKAAIITGLGNALKGSAAVGAASGFTEVAKILAEEMSKNTGTDEAGFWNALASASTKANALRVGSATAGGAAMGALLEVPLQIAGFGATKQRFEEGFNQYVRNMPESRDVTPEALKALPGAPQPHGEMPIDVTPEGGGGGQDHLEQSYKALQLNEALHNINDVQKSTNMNKIAPSELNEVNKQNFLAAGINKFYSTFTSMKDWANSDEKGLAARKLIDPSGTAAGQMNAPFELDPHDVMEIAKTYPDILDHISHAPDAPTGMQAKEHVEALQRAEEQRTELMTKLGIKPEEVQPESNVTELEQPPKQEKIAYSIEADVRQTQALLDQKKELQKRIDESEAALAAQKEDTGNVTDIKQPAIDKVVNKRVEEIRAQNQKAIEAIDAKLAEVKDRVTNSMKENPPGSVLSYPFDEKKAADSAEMRFGHEPTFTEALRTVLPEEQVAKFDDAVLRSRQHVVNAVRDQAAHEMNKVVNQTIALAQEDAHRAELERIAHDPNYAVVDKFHAYQVANSKGKNKRSIYAIDPETLSDDLLHYADNARLKAHKVFAKGASSAEDSAKALGFNSAKDLLDVLSKTPTRKQILAARAAFYDSHIETMAKAGVDLDHTNIMKAFTEKTKAYLEGMRYLKDNDWTKTKFGIKKIALPLPKIEELEHQARETVKSMKVGSLTPSQFVVGERVSYRGAVNKFLAGDLAGAFQEKENAARNNEMQKEVRKAISEVNRAQKFFRRLNEPAAQEVMRTAGKTAQNALDEITDVFNFNPKRKGQSELNSFNKWVRREVEQGRGDFTIPDRLSDVRQSIDEMSVEQVRAAHDRAKAIFNEAKYKAELIENKETREEERSVDRIAQQIQELEKVHPGTSDKNVPNVQETKDTFQALRGFLRDAEMSFSNMDHVLRYYDQGKLNGFFKETFFDQLKGDGRWNLKSGYSKENKMIQHFAETFRKITDNHGDFDALEKKTLTIPEFADVPSLNNGQLTKGDLLTAWMYKGDPAGVEKLTKNHVDGSGRGIPLETWQKVLDRELEERDVTAGQYIVDMFKQYQDETADLQNRTKGEDVVFIKGVPNQHRDKTFPGGYLHLNYRHEFTADAAKRTIEVLEGKRAAFFEKDDGAEFGRQFAAEQTEQGRLNERSSSDKPLDLSLLRAIRAHEEIISDLSYREATMNNLKLLRDKRIRESLIRMGGQGRYNMLVNTTIEMAGRAEAMNANYFSDQNRFFKSMFGHLQSNFNVTVLGLNLTSTAVQYESLTQLWQNIGLKGQKHFAIVNAQMMSHPHLWTGFYNWANEIDPTVGHFMEGIQNKITSVVHDLVPTKSRVPYLGPMKAAHQWSVNKMMAPMALADVHLKVMSAMTTYRQFMAGDAEGWPLERVMALPEAERDQQAVAYARQVSRLSLTHARPEDKSPSQKNPMMGFFSNYWNDLRNVLNNEFNQARKAKYAATGAGNSVMEMMKHSREGNSEEAAQSGKQALGYFGTAAGVAMATMVFATMGRWYSDKLRGIQQTPDQMGFDLKTAKGIKDAAQQMGYYSLMSPIDQMASVQPILKDVFWAANMPDKVTRGYVDKTKTVQVPITKLLSEVATAGNTLADAVSQSNSLSSFLFYLSNLDNKETKALLDSASYLGIPMPVNAYSKMMRALDLPLNQPSSAPQAAFEKLHEAIGKFKNGPMKLDINPEFHADLEKIDKQIAPVAVTVPDGMTDTMKYAMTGADWSKPNGIYGFTKEQWNEVKSSAPDLGLTDAGRISKNTGQQEKAMDWFLHEAAQKLAENDIRVDKTALYGSFKLGVDKYEALYKAPNDAKIKTVLGAEVLDKNPDLQQFKTVGQVKIYLNNQSNKAAQHAHGPTAQLTPTTNKAED